MPRIALPPIASWSSVGTGLTAANGKIGLAQWGRTIFSDDFADSSLHANFTAVVAGAGAVTETGLLTCDFSSATTDAAFVFYETTLDIDGAWKIKIKIEWDTFTTATCTGIGLQDNASNPAALGSNYSTFFSVINQTSSTNTQWLIQQDGVIYSYLRKATVTPVLLSNSVVNIATTTGSDYWYVIEAPGFPSPIKISRYTDNESTLDIGPVYISRETLKGDSNNKLWVILGCPWNNSGRGIIKFGLFEHKGLYVTASPEADTGWFAVDQTDLDGTNPLGMVTVLGGAGANIKAQYQVNGVDSWLPAATWTTLTDLNTELQALALTDTTNSLRIKFQFNSDGNTNAELIVGSHLLADAVTPSAGGGRPEIRGGNL